MLLRKDVAGEGWDPLYPSATDGPLQLISKSGKKCHFYMPDIASLHYGK